MLLRQIAAELNGLLSENTELRRENARLRCQLEKTDNHIRESLSDYHKFYGETLFKLIDEATSKDLS